MMGSQKLFASICEKVLGNETRVGRIGGEEFSIMLRKEKLDSIKIAEEIRHEVSTNHFENSGNLIVFTASIGISMCQSNENNIDHALERADKALYVAKARGRNCVEFDD